MYGLDAHCRSVCAPQSHDRGLVLACLLLVKTYSAAIMGLFFIGIPYLLQLVKPVV